jgi:fucose 4-O-acetylase-like acetyltransferase
MSAQPPQKPKESQRPAFAANVQLALIVLMLVSFVLMAQQYDRSIYSLGLNALIVFTLLQIVFGNIPSHFNFRQSMVGVIIGAVIISAIVILSINLVPSLLMLGR